MTTLKLSCDKALGPRLVSYIGYWGWVDDGQGETRCLGARSPGEYRSLREGSWLPPWCSELTTLPKSVSIDNPEPLAKSKIRIAAHLDNRVAKPPWPALQCGVFCLAIH